MSWQSLLNGKVQRIGDPNFYVESYKPGATRLYCAFRTINEQGGAEKLSDWLPYRGMMDWLDGHIAAQEKIRPVLETIVESHDNWRNCSDWREALAVWSETVEKARERL